MKPWIYIFITTEKLNFAKMSVTTLLHSHDDLFVLKFEIENDMNKTNKQTKNKTKQLQNKIF